VKPEHILAEPARVLAQAMREAYFQQGYAIAQGFLQGEWLNRLREAYLAAVERSRRFNQSNQWFSLQADHHREQPRIQRIERLPDQDDRFWDFVIDSNIADLAADIVGPDVVYRDSMINVKCPGTGGAVAWHQDLPFYPHTNTATIQILIALYDVPAEQGPVTVVKGSHRGPIYEHYDGEGNWSGKIRDSDHDSIAWGDAVELPCRAGDAILLHPLTVHGSGPNRSSRSRPYLIHGMSAADAISYTPMTWGNSHSGDLICGKPARFAHHEAMTIPLPPDWSNGYTSIFEHHARSES
jgi:ectoine hydroxylase-related dioxygenase (phytanoyl-CoA dioxygenase family)